MSARFKSQLSAQSQSQNATLTHFTEKLRNIGIAAHIDAGKTTLTERILLHSGAIHSAGEVHDGNTTTDFSDIERQKGITISSASVPVHWTPQAEGGVAPLHTGERHRLNVIDTPGHVDFTAEVERSLRVLDGMIAVFCGVGGVQPQSETVWRQADRYGVPRLAFINKMDRAGASFERVVQELREKLGANAWPTVLPDGSESELRGQLDVIHQRALVSQPGTPPTQTVEALTEAQQERVQIARANLVEALASLDDEVAALWLEGHEVPSLVLQQAVRRQTLAGRFLPVLGGSAYRHVGVISLLNAVVDYLPSPVDMATLRPVPAEVPVAALAFKVVRHPQAGRLVYVRVYAGSLHKGMELYNPRTRKTERLGRLLRLFADRRDELDAVGAGDICAVVGLQSVSTGDTLCLPGAGREILLEPPQFPEPVLSMAIEAAHSNDQTRLATALARLSDEDPTFQVRTHEETGQCLIAGMGELHLEIIREKLSREHHVETRAGAPEIACRETIQQTAVVDYELKKQNGGSGMYARVKLAVQPVERGAGLSVEDAVSGGTIPTKFLSAVHRGIEEAARNGVLNGSPVVDVQVRILDGAAHVKDSNEQAFRLAAAEAFREALRDARPVLLEPVMRAQVTVPELHQGDILGDLNRRRARITGMESGTDAQALAVVTAEVPLAEMFGYAGAIRSLSKGRASYSMTPSGYEPAPEVAVR